MTTLTLNAFNPVREANHNQRFCIVQDEVQVAKEGFRGRVLSFLGVLPLFRNIEAVKTHVEQVKAQNKEALATFVKALSSGNQAMESLIRKCLDLSGAKPLTARMIKQVEQCAQHHAKAFGLARVEPTDVAECQSKNAVNRALEGLAKHEPLKKLDGPSLQQGFSEFSSGNGALRSIATALEVLSFRNELPQIQDCAKILSGVKVAGIPFGSWGEANGPAANWMGKAKPEQMENAATQICEIVEEITKLEVAAKAYVEEGKITTLPRPTFGFTRFKNISVAPETQVMLADGRPLPVNKISVGEIPVALAGSYPKNTPAALAAHLRMLVEQNCSSLVVLAGNDQVSTKKGGLPPYFVAGNRFYGDVEVSSKLMESRSIDGLPADSSIEPRNNKGCPALQGALMVEKYELNISIEGRSFILPVIHATNWPDHGILKDSVQLEALAKWVQDINDKSEPVYANLNEGLPMIHCKGGVGRTGTLITALELIKDSSADVDGIIKEIRAARNDKMCEDKEQVWQLKQMADRLENGNDFVDIASLDLVSKYTTSSESLYANAEPLYANAEPLYANVFERRK